MRDSLSHPFLKLLSPVDGRDAGVAGGEPGERCSTRCGKSGARRRTTIRSHFGSGAKWANKPYKDDEQMAEAFRQVDACLGAPEFPPSALDGLQTFRSSAIAAKVSKRAKLPAPKHRFFDLCEELAQAAEHYIIGVKLEALRYVEQELPRRKDELKIQFFDDLLSRVHGALTGGGGAALATVLRRQYRGGAD